MKWLSVLALMSVSGPVMAHEPLALICVSDEVPETYVIIHEKPDSIDFIDETTGRLSNQGLLNLERRKEGVRVVGFLREDLTPNLLGGSAFDVLVAEFGAQLIIYARSGLFYANCVDLPPDQWPHDKWQEPEEEDEGS